MGIVPCNIEQLFKVLMIWGVVWLRSQKQRCHV